MRQDRCGNGGDLTVKKKRAAVVVVMTGKKRAWNDETRLRQGATEQKQHTKGCVCLWWVVWQEGRQSRQFTYPMSFVFRLTIARQLNQKRSRRMGMGWADWTGLDWTGRWLNSRCVRVGSSETE